MSTSSSSAVKRKAAESASLHLCNDGEDIDDDDNGEGDRARGGAADFESKVGIQVTAAGSAHSASPNKRVVRTFWQHRDSCAAPPAVYQESPREGPS